MKIKNNNFGKSGFGVRSKLNGGQRTGLSRDYVTAIDEEPQAFSDGTLIDFTSSKLGNIKTDSINLHTKSSQLPPKEKQVLTNYNKVIVELDEKEQQIIQYLSDGLNTPKDNESLHIFLVSVYSTLGSIKSVKRELLDSIYKLQEKIEKQE